tara:strand:+ start:105 stop:431 length:327 start_codon:yes stop_codon:yes gene_type:complete
MNYIELNSVGSTITNDGLVFPQDISEAPETASDAEEMMGVSVFDLDSEWIVNLSSEDLISLISFLDEHIGWSEDSQIHGSYEEWRTNTWSLWEDVNNCYMNLDSMAVA